MKKKEFILVFPGNTSINHVTVKKRYELIKNMSLKNSYNYKIINYKKIIKDKNFQINNILSSIDENIEIESAKIIFGLSYGCNIVLNLLNLSNNIFSNTQKICLFGAIPYWIFHYGLITNLDETKKYIKEQGFKINPIEAFNKEIPIEEIVKKYYGEKILHFGCGTLDKDSTPAFNKYLKSLNKKKTKITFFNGENHYITSFNKKYEKFIFEI
jgi:hypothetical protein